MKTTATAAIANDEKLIKQRAKNRARARELISKHGIDYVFTAKWTNHEKPGYMPEQLRALHLASIGVHPDDIPKLLRENTTHFKWAKLRVAAAFKVYETNLPTLDAQTRMFAMEALYFKAVIDKFKGKAATKEQIAHAYDPEEAPFNIGRPTARDFAQLAYCLYKVSGMKNGLMKMGPPRHKFRVIPIKEVKYKSPYREYCIDNEIPLAQKWEEFDTDEEAPAPELFTCFSLQTLI